MTDPHIAALAQVGCEEQEDPYPYAEMGPHANCPHSTPDDLETQIMDDEDSYGWQPVIAAGY